MCKISWQIVFDQAMNVYFDAGPHKVNFVYYERWNTYPSYHVKISWSIIILKNRSSRNIGCSELEDEVQSIVSSQIVKNPIYIIKKL